MARSAIAPLQTASRSQSITIDGEMVAVTVRTNPRARRLILKVDPVSGAVILVVPPRCGMGEALDFARRQEAWIAARRQECVPSIRFAAGVRIPVRGEFLQLTPASDLLRRIVRPDPDRAQLRVGGPPEHLPRRVEDWLKRTARQDLHERIDDHCAKLTVKARRITIRDTRTRWGSCSADGALSFSWRLIMAPPDVLDYVAAHEVAHLVHHDHSPAFWAVVRQLHGDPGGATQWLKRHGTELHRYGAD